MVLFGGLFLLSASWHCELRTPQKSNNHNTIKAANLSNHLGYYFCVVLHKLSKNLEIALAALTSGKSYMDDW